MNPIEEGKAFTNEVYASKKDLEAYYNLTDVKKNWENVLRYRMNFDVETDLKDKDSNHYKICLTRSILSQSYGLEMRLMEDLLTFASLSQDFQNDFVLKRKIHALQAVLMFSGHTNINQSTLEKLALGEMESIPSSLFLSDAYSKAYNFDFFSDGLTLNGFGNINRQVIGSNYDDEIQYRSEVPTDIKNPLLPLDAKSIPAYLTDAISFLGQKEIPNILKALSLIYFFAATRPYEYFNEGTAALICKNYLADSGLRTLGFVLDFESIAFASGKEYYSKAKLSETTLDLTYYLVHVFPYLVKEEENMRSELEKLKEMQSSKAELKDAKEEPDDESDSPSFALPVFPVAKKEDDIELTAKKLREVYPQLKKKEAHFYAGHCTIGLNYTIEQFKKEEKTVYETARTNMDDLAKRGFYKKNKIQKKFVYTPIPLDIDPSSLPEEKIEEDDN